VVRRPSVFVRTASGALTKRRTRSSRPGNAEGPGRRGTGAGSTVILPPGIGELDAAIDAAEKEYLAGEGDGD
jgi:hypothetical protein